VPEIPRPKAGAQPETADRAGFLVGIPAAADEIAADDALDGQWLQLLHDHAPKLSVAGRSVFAGQQAGLVGQEVIGTSLRVCANHHRLICGEHDPLPGIPSGRITSKAESRSVAAIQQGVAEVEDFRAPCRTRAWGRGGLSIWVTAVGEWRERCRRKITGDVCRSLLAGDLASGVPRF